MDDNGALQAHRFVPVKPLEHDIDAQKRAVMARIKERAAKRKLESKTEVDQSRVKQEPLKQEGAEK